MTQTSYAEGSVFPPLEAGVLRLYNMRFCPYSQRTRLVLAHKNIPYETVNVHLKRKPEWFLERNPFGLVPTLERNGRIVYESGICDDYLDALYPTNKLYPDDPYEKAKIKMLMDRFSKIPGLLKHLELVNYEQSSTVQDLRDCHVAFHVAFQPFEQALEGKTFFGGDTLNMVDLYIWPWFERMSLMSDIIELDILPKILFSKLNAWVKAMQSTDTAKNACTPMEHFKAYWEINMAKSQDPPYDIGL